MKAYALTSFMLILAVGSFAQIDPGVWGEYDRGHGTPFTLEEIPAGSGNYVVCVTASSQYDRVLYSVQGFDRANDLAFEFDWFAPGGPPSCCGSVGTGFTPLQNYDSLQYPSLYFAEAGITGQANGTSWQPKWHEYQGDAWPSGAAALDATFTAAITAAVSPDTAVRIRIELGTTAGARGFWSDDDGATWYPIMSSDGTTVIDTTSMSAGETYSEPGGGNWVVQGNSPVYVGLGMSHTMICWDNLVVYEGSTEVLREEWSFTPVKDWELY